MDGIEAYIDRFALGELLSPELRASLALRAYRSGEHIIRSGDRVEGLLFFVEGRAKVYKAMEGGSTLLVRFYSPFDILGDVELFSYERYMLDVVALSDTVCLGLSAEAIRRRPEGNCALLMELCSRLGRKLGDFNAQAAINLSYPVENRLASYLLAVEGDASGWKDLGTEDLGELAELLGTSYRQLSRVMRKFKDEGILEEGRGKVRVIAREALVPLARDSIFQEGAKPGERI